MTYTTTGMVKRQMEAKDARFWTVYDSKENVIATNPANVSTLGPTGSFEKLEEVLNECSGDYVKVTIRTKDVTEVDDASGRKLPNPKGNSTYGPYYLQCTPVPGGGINGTGDVSMQKRIWDLEQQLKDVDRDRKFEDLQKKIEGLTSAQSKNGVFDLFMTKIATNIADKFTGSDIRAALNNSVEAPKETTEPVAGPVDEEKEKTVVMEFLKNAASAMGDNAKTLDAVKALAAYAKKDPATFKMTAETLIKRENV